MDATSFLGKLKNIFSVDRKNKIDADDLKDLTSGYQSKYKGLSDQQLILAFSEDFKRYLKFLLAEEKCWYNPDSPQYFLLSSARAGTLSIILFNGYIPKDKLKLLEPYIKKMIIKIFQLRDFDGFSLVIKHRNKITSSSSITLVWGDHQPKTPSADQAVIQILEPKKKSKKTQNSASKQITQNSASKQVSKNNYLNKKGKWAKSGSNKSLLGGSKTDESSLFNLEASELISEDVVEKIEIPVYDPSTYSKDEIVNEIRKDVQNNCMKLRSEIKREVKMSDESVELEIRG